MTEVIGFIGAGQMGEPMVDRLLGAGHQVHVYAGRADVRDRLAAVGAVAVDSIPDLARRSDILIACVFSDAQLRDIGTGPYGVVANAKPGAVFVSHTTGSLSTLTGLAASCPAPPTILDAPVSHVQARIPEGPVRSFHYISAT